MSLGVEQPSEDQDYNIFIAVAPGSYEQLSGESHLEQVNEKFWKVNKPLEMYYSPAPKDELQQ